MGRYLVRIVQPDVGQSKIAAALQVHREASVEAGDARNMPSLAVAVRAKEAVKGKLPVVAGHQVMPHVKGGETIVVTIQSARIVDGSNGIHRLGVGIARPGR